jgi:hypothetical protein
VTLDGAARGQPTASGSRTSGRVDRLQVSEIAPVATGSGVSMYRASPRPVSVCRDLAQVHAHGYRNPPTRLPPGGACCRRLVDRPDRRSSWSCGRAVRFRQQWSAGVVDVVGWATAGRVLPRGIGIANLLSGRGPAAPCSSARGASARRCRRVSKPFPDPRMRFGLQPAPVGPRRGHDTDLRRFAADGMRLVGRSTTPTGRRGASALTSRRTSRSPMRPSTRFRPLFDRMCCAGSTSLRTTRAVRGSASRR